MKLTIQRRDLLALLTNARHVVERKNTIPILGNVSLKAKDNTLAIKVTDLDIEFENSVACEVASPGSTTVPAHMLLEIVKKLKVDSEIVIEQDIGKETKCKVRTGRSRFTLNTLPIEDFPDLTIKDVLHTFEIPAAHLSNIFDRTQFCISTEETRYYLNGVFLHHVNAAETTKLRGCSTDGHRLAQVDCDAPAGADAFRDASNLAGVIVPRKTVGLLLTILADGGVEKVGVQMSESRAVFTLGNIRIASKLIDGTFPDYNRVVPQGNDKIVTVERTELAGAIDRLSVVSEKGRAAKFAFSAGKLTLSVTTDDGSATEELDVDYDGEPLDVGFNSHYAIEILNNMEGDKIEIRLADPGSPALFTGIENTESLFVLMPMRV